MSRAAPKRCADAAPPSGPAALSMPTAMCAAALGGLLLACAFPDRGWWPLALPGIGLLVAGLYGRRTRPALLLGLVGGLAFFLSLVSWSSLFLGPVPYLALSIFCALWWAASAAATAAALRGIARRYPQALARRLAPLAAAGLWTLREALLSVWPYGGFAWGRVAQSQSASPFAELVSWLGLSGLGFLMVWAASAAAQALLPKPQAPPHSALPAAPAWPRLAAVLCGVALLAALPAFPVRQTGSLRIAAVQGATPQAGYFTPGERGEVLAEHLRATLEHVPPDAGVRLVLWPEGSVDLSPVRDPRVAQALSRLSARYDAPVVGNTVTLVPGADGGEDRYYNSSFAWTAQHGWGAQYDKQHPVPFGEYIPDREFYALFAPELVGLVQRGYTPGEGAVVLPLADSRAGVFICFDIVDDGLATRAVRDEGAQWLYAPTNNADFGDTDELGQQLAFARLRAIETGRAIVQVSTVGDSAVYGPDGRELASIPRLQEGAMIVDVPLSSGTTPAVLFGRGLEQAAGVLGTALLLGPRLGATGRAARATRASGRDAPAGS